MPKLPQKKTSRNRIKHTIAFLVVILSIAISFVCGTVVRQPFFGDVAGRKYSDSYSCLQFSQDLVEKLKARGIQSEVIRGYKPDGTPHAWVAVYIEPQTGEFTEGYTK
jgi:hypothetical protein